MNDRQPDNPTDLSKRTAWFKKIAGIKDTDIQATDAILKEALDGYREAFAGPCMANEKVADPNPAIPQSLKRQLATKGFSSSNQLLHQAQAVTLRARDRFAADNDKTFDLWSASLGAESGRDRILQQENPNLQSQSNDAKGATKPVKLATQPPTKKDQGNYHQKHTTEKRIHDEVNSKGHGGGNTQTDQERKGKDEDESDSDCTMYTCRTSAS